MSILYILISAMEAVGLVLAIRGLLARQKTLDAQNAAIADLRARNAQLMFDTAEDRDAGVSVNSWYTQLFNSTNDMVFVHRVTEAGMAGEFLEVNDVTCKRLGYTRDDLLTMTPADIEDEEALMPAWVRPSIADHKLYDGYVDKYLELAIDHSARRRVSQVLNQTEPLVSQVLFKARSGERIPVEVISRRLDLYGAPTIMSTARDIAERLKHEHAARDSERQLESFFAHSPVGIAMYDAQRQLTKANAACLTMFGLLDIEQMSRFNLFANPYIPADIRDKLGQIQNLRYEMTVDFDDAVRRSLCVTSRKGEGHFDVRMNCMGYDAQGGLQGFFAQIQDITGRRQVEAQLRRMQTSADKEVSEKGIKGNLSDMAFSDMIQVLCAGGKNAEISLKRGNLQGQVFIREGSVVHCLVGDAEGEEAFYRLMKWRDGEFVTRQRSRFPRVSIQSSVMSLLMEGARRLDEDHEQSRSQPFDG